MVEKKQQNYVLTLTEEKYQLVIDALSYYAHVSVSEEIGVDAKNLYDELWGLKLKIAHEILEQELLSRQIKCSDFCMGDRVIHVRKGEGTVIHVDSQYGYIVVRFDKNYKLALYFDGEFRVAKV